MTIANTAFQPFRRQHNLTGELVDRLTSEIVSGQRGPCERLPTERELMVAYGVSRTVVREAIAALRADGLVETRQGSGAFVCEDPHLRAFRIDRVGFQSASKVFDVMELRMTVEVEAAGLAAKRRNKSDLANLAATVSAFSSAIARDDPGIDADFKFHSAIGAATGNAYFLSFLDFIGRIIIPRRNVHVGAVDEPELQRYLKCIDREHRAIERAIAERNIARARSAMRTHLTQSRERYIRLVRKGGS